MTTLTHHAWKMSQYHLSQPPAHPLTIQAGCCPSIRDQQLEVVPLLTEIAKQQRDSEVALKAVLSELQLLKSRAMP